LYGVHVGKYLYDAFSTHSGLLFNFALEYAIRKVQGNQKVMKQKGAYQLLICADRVNFLVENIIT
jgi:hypothetical protein